MSVVAIDDDIRRGPVSIWFMILLRDSHSCMMLPSWSKRSDRLEIDRFDEDCEEF